MPYRRRFVEKTDEIWRFPPETANSYLVLISDIEMKRNIKKIRSRNNALSERKIPILYFKETAFLCFFDGQLTDKVIKFVEFQAAFFFRVSPTLCISLGIFHFIPPSNKCTKSLSLNFSLYYWPPTLTSLKRVNSGKSRFQKSHFFVLKFY